jgi:oxygen-independent coproporphyrinogen-3 oxidase
LNTASDIGIYLHWPFCEKKCPYCDFNSHVSENIDHLKWLNGYLNELKYYANLTPGRTISSVFFGGGTPSLMEPSVVEKILDEIHSLWQCSNDIEITAEANPSSSETQLFRDFKTAGINRLSIGVQSLNDRSLSFLGRLHSANEARNAIVAATKIFPRVSFDLIYALPGQSKLTWERELTHALELARGHLSLYQLTIEPGTAFSKSRMKVPNDRNGAALYELTQELTEKANLKAYEISNHAKTGQESRHNQSYWESGDYIGVGPGAHGRITTATKTKIMHNYRQPEFWLDLAIRKRSGQQKCRALSQEERRAEIIMMGLRLIKGLSVNRFNSLTGHQLLDTINKNKITALSNKGYLKLNKKYLKTTLQGRLRLNAILSYLLA